MAWQDIVAVTVIATFIAGIAGGLMELRVRKLLELRDLALAAKETAQGQQEEREEEKAEQALGKLQEKVNALEVRLTRQEAMLETYLEMVKRSGARLLKDMIG